MNYKYAKELLHSISQKYLKDIDCEVCGYHGTPTDHGFCPKCGALGGLRHEVHIDPRNVNIDYRRYGIPKDGVSVYELDELSRATDFTY